MALKQKTITEKIEFREVSLRTRRTYTGGEDIKTRYQSDNWDDVAKKETEWEE